MKVRIALVAVAAALTMAAPAAATQPIKPKPVPGQPCAPGCCEQVDELVQQFSIMQQTIQRQGDQLTVLNQRLEQLENWVALINVNVNVVINRVQTLSCESDRVYDFRIRTQVDGSPVTAVERVQVMGQDVTQDLQDKDRGGWHVNGGGRLAVRASYAGVVAPAGQVRTVVVFARTQDGRLHRLAQKLRLCLEDDGNMNDRTAQGRADD
jgi:hypothetical protein